MHLIVARYNENIEWISTLGYTYTVYNKGEYQNRKDFINVPNKGRESETYLRYIVDNYENLPNTMIFLQGNPYDHCEDLKDQILKYNKQPYYFLGKEPIWNYGDGKPWHPGLNIVEIAKLLDVYTGKNKYYFTAGAQFIVTAKTIKKRSLTWWKKAYEVHEQFPLSPWVYERLWQDIFAI